MDRLAVILHVAFCLTVLVAPTCSSSSWARNVLSRPKRQDESQPSRNETRESCLLPQQPDFGSYTSPACENGKTTCRHVPGTPVPEFWLLSFKCNDGYYTNGTFEDKVLLFCNNGKWSEKIPVCRMLVTPTSNSSSLARNECQSNQFTCTSGACIDTTSVCNGTVECRDGSDETENACRQKYITQKGCLLPQQPEFGSYTSPACENGTTTCKQVPGTPVPQYSLLSFKCNSGYYINGTFEDKVLLLCINGNWSQKIPVCLPVCGRMNSEQRTSLLNVSGSSTAELPTPWLALVYSNITAGWNDICTGGILISPHTVMIRAYWVDKYRYRESPHNVRVAVGKRSGYWNNKEPGSVIAEVRQIAVHPRYSGRDTYLAYDVALIDLKTSVPINSYIMPACVDWDRDLVLTTGQLGMTDFVWGNGNLSTLRVTYKDSELCRDELPPAYRIILTPDKLCLKPIDENEIGFGYIDATFESKGVHYIKGATSTGYAGSDGQKLLFVTNLGDKDVLEWLQRTKRSFDEVHNGT